ncbi:helix-turn-helix transcriptional regulator [Nocardia asteroides NBRC 15531]|nr:helix-turn-helix transcriptional regulator [Nocardia asteroides]TLF63412.1 helix-turn-helix transcriptional regulator [Nocardia asteroides NBRC 15531]UGT47153.1 helix-turn-helix domain-containing protein [Nocardia asteroides]SFM78048.1 Helix-turn-helix domain-containing protein [Nocardia asteroides]VEG33967.1 anaerobic benzoate catabolism transcriptional regulator [Nocardia asteroides]
MGEHSGLRVIPGGRGEGRPRPEPLWREALGDRLRALRQERRSTLVETASRAGISPQYLSEVERGRKEPSSEMIAALAGALDTSLSELVAQVADAMRRAVPVRAVVVGEDRRIAAPTGPAPVRNSFAPNAVLLAA